MKFILSESQIDRLFKKSLRDVKEDIFLKKDEKNKQLVIFSDKAEERERTKETIGLKDKFKKLGFKWTGKAWVGDYSKFDEINKLIKSHNKLRTIIDKLEDLEEMVESDSDLPTDKKTELITKIDLYINDLVNATDAATMDAAIRRYLTFHAKFYNYSINNTLLILIQNPNATKVMSYHKWKKLFNRGVKKGAKAISVWAPLLKKVGNEKDVIDYDNEKQIMGNSKKIVGFRLVNVYDVADTYALSDEGEIPAQPQWWSENTPSKTAEILMVKLKEVADDLGIKLSKEKAKGSEKGYSAGGHINLSSDISGVAEASTMVHELAHELLHHSKSSKFYINDPEKQTAQNRELHAESVSYIVMKHYELPVTHHPTYLALWKVTGEKIMKNLDVIQKCAKELIDMIDGVQVDETEFEDA